MTPEEATAALLTQFPDFELTDWTLKSWTEQGLMYSVFYEFGQYVLTLLSTNDEEKLRAVFSFMEGMAEDADQDTRDLLQVGFLEDLGKTGAPDYTFDKDAVEKSTAYMGLKTYYLLREMEAMWQDNRDEFHRTTPSPYDA